MKKRLEERNALVSGMAERCGADVAEAFRQGVIGPREYKERLTRCCECEATEACRRLLAAVEELSAPPEYCRNRDEIQDLKQRLDKAFT